jgi:Flp pilus assembly protein TadG
MTLVITVLLGFTALVTDIGAGQNQLRQNSTAADAAALAAAAHLALGATDATSTAMAVARQNLQQTYTDSQWTGMWSACSDPDRNVTRYPDVSSASPCISFARGMTRVRVRLPDQTTSTTFARFVGVSQIKTHAVAEAQLMPPAGGGVLPFGVLNFNTDAQNQICLTGAAGCGGGSGDILRALNSPLVGNPMYGTTEMCQYQAGDNFQYRVELNTAMGLDHLLVQKTSSDPTRTDDCRVQLPNTVYATSLQGSGGGATPTKTQFITGLGLGLITGPSSGSSKNYPDGQPARLERIPNVPGWETRKVGGYTLDNRGLWEFIPLKLPAKLPPSCDRQSGSGLQSPNKAKMQACLSDYILGNYTVPLFTQRSTGTPPGMYDIQMSSRFAFVPSFSGCCGDGTVDQLGPIEGFHMAFLQTMYLNSSDSLLFEPGEATSAMTLSQFDGLSALRITDPMVPQAVLASGPNGSLRGASVQLVT